MSLHPVHEHPAGLARRSSCPITFCFVFFWKPNVWFNAKHAKPSPLRALTAFQYCASSLLTWNQVSFSACISVFRLLHLVCIQFSYCVFFYCFACTLKSKIRFLSATKSSCLTLDNYDLDETNGEVCNFTCPLCRARVCRMFDNKADLTWLRPLRANLSTVYSKAFRVADRKASLTPLHCVLELRHPAFHTGFANGYSWAFGATVFLLFSHREIRLHFSKLPFAAFGWMKCGNCNSTPCFQTPRSARPFVTYACRFSPSSRHAAGAWCCRLSPAAFWRNLMWQHYYNL